MILILTFVQSFGSPKARSGPKFIILRTQSKTPGNLSKFINAAFATRQNRCPEALKMLSSDSVEVAENVYQTGESIRTMHFNNLGK